MMRTGTGNTNESRRIDADATEELEPVLTPSQNAGRAAHAVAAMEIAATTPEIDITDPHPGEVTEELPIVRS